jgi:hypothetical protein
MTTPTPSGPCEPWPFDPQCCAPADGATEAQILRARRIATELLYRLSGMQYGPSCPITVRPCLRKCAEGSSLFAGALWSSPWIPYVDGAGVWRNASVCGCRQSCSCTELSEISLDGTVYDIVSVQLGPDVMPAEDYRLDYAKGWRLVRLDGEAWPSCQDMAAEVGDEGAFAVTYRTGIPLDYSGQAAYDALVCHLLRECGGVGACSCKLPANVTRVSRQGVDIEFAEATELRLNGWTGVPATDAWLRAVNPYGQTSPSRVYSVDYPRARYTKIP